MEMDDAFGRAFIRGFLLATFRRGRLREGALSFKSKTRDE
jgi:hypothetical protein